MYIIITFFSFAILCLASSLFFPKTKRNGYKECFFDKNYTTIAKGIAIFMIMLCHMSCFWPGGRLLSPLGGTGVAIFLVTSGYGLMESYKRVGLENFWKKRLLRVWIPYAIVCLLLCIFKGQSVFALLKNLVLITSPFWFVRHIILYYIIFYVVLKFFEQYKISIFLIIAILSLFITKGVQGEQAFSFVIGVLLSVYRDSVRTYFIAKSKRYATIGIPLFFVGALFLFIKQFSEVRDSSYVIMNVVQALIKLPFAMSIILMLAYFVCIRSNPMLYLMGLISYELYLVHFPFWHSADTTLWPSLLVIFLSIPVSYIFYLFNNIAAKKLS